MGEMSEKPGLSGQIEAFLNPRVVTMLFLGFSAGIPILLIFSSLSLWLREAGVERATVTYFSWAALGYSFKFIWAPLVDQLPIPFLTTMFGRRRSWILLAQLSIILSIVAMSNIDPASTQSALSLLALSAVMLGFSSATQDIVIDAYRIESAGSEWQGLMSATYIAGYRIAMIVAGAGSLYLASWMGSTMENYVYEAWQYTYLIMAGIMLIGVFTTLLIPEPDINRERKYEYQTIDYSKFLLGFLLAVVVFIVSFKSLSVVSSNLQNALTPIFSNQHLASFIIESLRLLVSIGFAGLLAFCLIKFRLLNPSMVENSYVLPVRDFFSRYGLKIALLLLLLIGTYRISDIVLGVISNVFYQDMGYSKTQIANVVKVFGVVATIAGSFIGGLLALRFGIVNILLLGAVLSALTNLLFLLLASIGPDLFWLVVVISADNLSAGLASAAFVAFLSGLTNVSFTAMQFAIFTSMMTLLPKVLGGYSGSIVDSMGYPSFFIVTAMIGLPVIALIFVIRNQLQLGKFVLAKG